MGLFSRKESGSARRQASRPRPSVSSEAQAATLRVKARRRLTGAVALVLAVVVVLPMLLDGEPKPIPAGVEIIIPSKNSPYEPITAASSQAEVGESTAGDSTAVDTTSPSPSSPTTPNDVDQSVSQATTATAAGGAPPVTDAPAQKPKASDTPATKATESAASDAASSAKPAPGNEPKRTDDGSRALALLAGKAPAVNETESSTGQLIVQIASYSAEADAKSQQEKLKTEGVSNAFVEESLIDGKTMYRLRVGPFGSREAAQAAQTRLRTLGYSNGFIATQ